MRIPALLLVALLFANPILAQQEAVPAPAPAQQPAPAAAAPVAAPTHCATILQASSPVQTGRLRAR